MVATYAALAAGLVLAGLAITHIGPLTRWDDRVNTWFVARRTPFWNHVSWWGTFIANTLGVVVVAAVVVAVLAIRRRFLEAALVTGGLIVELAVFLTVNYAVGRPRPKVPHLGSTPSTYSFPSGHAAATLVLYGGLALIVTGRTRHLAARAVTWTLAVVFPLWVAFSRVSRGQHHLTDVIAGLALGAGVLLLLTPVTAGARRDADVDGVADVDDDDTIDLDRVDSEHGDREWVDGAPIAARARSHDHMGARS
jgi:undecaprenyl-diphosphatase